MISFFSEENNIFYNFYRYTRAVCFHKKIKYTLYFSYAQNVNINNIFYFWKCLFNYCYYLYVHSSKRIIEVGPFLYRISNMKMPTMVETTII